MSSVTVFTAARMQEIEDTTVVGGLVDASGHLLLSTREGTEIDAGLVRGADGAPGTPGTPGAPGAPGAPGTPGEVGIPAGTISLYGGETAPTNWLLCDGSAVSRSTYASLFSAIGTKYGVGDGVTTFNLPNLKGRTPVGKDTTQTEFDNLGETGGAKTHDHALSDNGYARISLAARTTHQIFMRRVTAVFGASFPATHSISSTNLGSGAGTYSATTENTGAGLGGLTDAASSLPPYQVVNFIIKHSAGETPGDTELGTRVGTLETNFNNLLRGSEIPSGVDLNNYYNPGMYVQSENADAVAGVNYPVALAGVLEVTANSNNNMVWQTYTPYNGYAETFYKRTRNNGVWSSWYQYKSTAALAPSWTYLSYVAGYAAYDSFVAGATSKGPRYRVVNDTCEIIGGFVGKITTSVTYTANSVYNAPFGTMPSGTKPDALTAFSAIMAYSTGRTLMEIRVLPDGTWQMIPSVGGTLTAGASNGFIVLQSSRYIIGS